LRDWLVGDIHGYIKYCQKTTAESGKPMSRNFSEFIGEAQKYLKTLEQMPPKQAPVQETEPSVDEINRAFMDADEIPF